MSTDRRKIESNAHFLLEDGSVSDTRIPIDADFSVGRGEDCGLTLESTKASRLHANVILEGDQVWVEDLNSTNGTFINENKVSGKVKAESGDLVRFGDVSYRLIAPSRSGEVDEQQEAAQATPADEGATVLVSASSVAAPAAPKAPAPAPPPAPAAKAPRPAGPADVAPKESTPDIPTSWADSEELEQASHTRFVIRDPTAVADSGAKDPAQAITEARRQVAAEQPILVGLTDPIRGQVFRLTRKQDVDTWEMGRDESADIVIDDESVSGRHAQLACEHGRWKVVNMMSVNGTFVNDRKSLSAFLNPQDRIRMGNVELAFDGPADAKAAKQAAKTSQSRKSQSFFARLWSKLTGRG